MPASDPAHTDSPRPLIYAAPCLVIAGGTFVTGVVFLVIAIDNPQNISARLLSSILLVLGVLGASCTVLAWRVDLARREARNARAVTREHAEQMRAQMDELAGVVNAALVQAQSLGRLASEAMDIAKANRVVILRAEARASESAEGWLAALGRYDEMRGQLEALERQQQTLAEMVCHPDRLVLEVPNDEIYELGRRVGQEEAQRRRGEDQTP